MLFTESIWVFYVILRLRTRKPKINVCAHPALVYQQSRTIGFQGALSVEFVMLLYFLFVLCLFWRQGTLLDVQFCIQCWLLSRGVVGAALVHCALDFQLRVCRGCFVETVVVPCSEGTLAAAVKRARPGVWATGVNQLCWADKHRSIVLLKFKVVLRWMVLAKYDFVFQHSKLLVGKITRN